MSSARRRADTAGPVRDRLVYSTDESERVTIRGTGPDPVTELPAERHDVRVRCERAGRRGKIVTVAAPFHLARQAAAELLKGLKRTCGSGGTVKPGRDREGRPCLEIEVQGDHAERVAQTLARLGYRVRVGGG